MSTARIPDYIQRTRGSANRAMQAAGTLAQSIAANMRYKADVYDIPTLNDALADLATAMDAIKTVRAVIEQANPIKTSTVIVGTAGAVEATVTRREPACARCNAPLGASQYTLSGVAYCSFECYMDGRGMEEGGYDV